MFNFLLEFKIKKALKSALEEYDKETIIDIIENEVGGWAAGCEILNIIKPEIAEKYLERIK